MKMSTVLDSGVNCYSSVLIIQEESIQSSDAHDLQKKEVSVKKTVCTKCNLTFSTRSSLLSHYKKFHPEELNNLRRKTNVICPVCDCDYSTIFHLQNHIKESHNDIKLMFENAEFFTWEDFYTWKSETEKQTMSLFLKRRAGTILADGRRVVHYYCHRSGCYRPQGTGKRRIKSIGSNKINKSCPAHMTVHSETNQDITLISVQYQSVHVGHQIDIERFPQSKCDQDAKTKPVGKVNTSKSKRKSVIKKFPQSKCDQDAKTKSVGKVNTSKSMRKRRKSLPTEKVFENTPGDYLNECGGNNQNHNENVQQCVETNLCYHYVNEEQKETYYIQKAQDDAIQSIFSVDDQKAMMLSKFVNLLSKSKTNEDMKIMFRCMQSMESMLSARNGDEAL